MVSVSASQDGSWHRNPSQVFRPSRANSDKSLTGNWNSSWASATGAARPGRAREGEDARFLVVVVDGVSGDCLTTGSADGRGRGILIQTGVGSEFSRGAGITTGLLVSFVPVLSGGLGGGAKGVVSSGSFVGGDDGGGGVVVLPAILGAAGDGGVCEVGGRKGTC